MKSFTTINRRQAISLFIHCFVIRNCLPNVREKTTWYMNEKPFYERFRLICLRLMYMSLLVEFEPRSNIVDDVASQRALDLRLSNQVPPNLAISNTNLRFLHVDIQLMQTFTATHHLPKPANIYSYNSPVHAQPSHPYSILPL